MVPLVLRGLGLRWLVPAIALAAMSAGEAVGQVAVERVSEPGRVVGRVFDPASGAGLAGVHVTVTGSTADATTDADGRFALGPVGPGRHRLACRLDGFQPVESPDVMVLPGQDVVVEIAFRLGISAEAGTTARVERPAAGSPVSVLGLTGRQIEATAGGLEDVQRTLQLAPGVASASDDNRNDVLVRGGGATENHTRIDGFDIPNASHFGAQGGTGGGLGLVAPWIIGRASLQVSGFSVALGERAASAIDIDLRPGNQQHLAAACGASIGGAMGVAEGPLGPGKGSWLVSARQSFLSLVFDQGDSRAIPTYGDVVARIEWRASAAQRFEILGISGRDAVEATFGRDQRERLDDRQGVSLVGFRWDGAVGPRTAVNIVAGFSAFTINASVKDRGAVDFEDRSREYEWRLRGEIRRTIGASAQVLAGVALKHADLSFNLLDGTYRNAFGNLVASIQVHARSRATDSAAYVEGDVPVGRRTRIVAGARLDRPGNTGGALLSPRTRIEHRLLSRLRLTGSAGVYRQMLPYIWTASNPANSTLPPVFTRQAAAGLEAEFPGATRFVVEAFAKRYRGYPVDVTEPSRVLVSAQAEFDSPFVSRLSPSGRVRAEGVDTAVERRVGSWLTVMAGYSHWRVRQQGLDDVWRAGDYDIRDQWRTLWFLQPTRSVSAGLTWRYASGRPYTPFDPKASIKAGGGRYDRAQINALRYPPYHRLDLRAGWQRRIGRTSLSIFGEVSNLYGRDNVLIYEWSASARQAKPIYQWGRLPVGGLRVEF